MANLPLIVAFWPFAGGWMLLWGLAAGIPIVIHLWNRRRYQVVAWAAMEYLLAAMKKHSRRITIEQLILLAVRILILLVLALALADPFLPSGQPLGANFSAGGQTHWVLVVDGSYSMNYRVGEVSRFEAAQQLAAQIVEQSTQGDGFTLVLMGDPPEAIVRQPAFSRDDVLEELTNLAMRHGGANLSATLTEVEKIVAAAKEKHHRLARTKVCFLTDLGRTTWDAVDTPDCRGRIAALAEVASLVMLDLGQTGQSNLAITRLEVDDPLVTIGRDVLLQAEVQNFGSQPRSGVAVELLVDGQSVQEQSISVEPGGSATASVVHRFAAPGEHWVEARVSGDQLEVDNHRWVSVPVRESIHVLCIEGTAGAARHVALALEPSQALRPRVATEVASESALLERDLSQFDCIFLCNVGRFGRDEAAVLHRFLAGGGGLVFFLGDQVRTDNYNKLLLDDADHRILPARLGDLAPTKQYHFDPLEYRHPIVAPFRGQEHAGLLTTPVWKYVRVKPLDPATARIALSFDGGDPAIVEENIARGRSILYAGAASDHSVDRTSNPPMPWTAMSSWPSFPPLVQEMLSLAVSGRSQGRNAIVGDDLQGVVNGVVEPVPLTVVAPDGHSERVKMAVDGADSRWAYSGTWLSGMYEARFDQPLAMSQYYAVNVNTRESDLERYDPELLPSQFSHEDEVDDAGAPVLPSHDPTKLFQFCLVALLGLLVIETFLARFFGRAVG